MMKRQKIKKSKDHKRHNTAQSIISNTYNRNLIEEKMRMRQKKNSIMAEYSNTNEGTQHRFKKCCNAKALKKK